MLAKSRLEILVLAYRTPHEAHALGLGAPEQQDAVADYPVAQQGRGVIEQDQVEPVARNLATQHVCQTPVCILDR